MTTQAQQAAVEAPTSQQILAAKLDIEIAKQLGEEPEPWIVGIANCEIPADPERPDYRQPTVANPTEYIGGVHSMLAPIKFPTNTELLADIMRNFPKMAWPDLPIPGLSDAVGEAIGDGGLVEAITIRLKELNTEDLFQVFYAVALIANHHELDDR